MDSETPAEPGAGVPVDVGYIVLDSCELALRLDGCNLTNNVWHDVCLRNDSLKDPADDSFANDLVLVPDSGDNIVPMQLTNAYSVPPFSGNVDEIAVRRKKRKIDSDTPGGRRSDASLLIGLAMSLNQQADAYDATLPCPDEEVDLSSLRASRFQVMVFKNSLGCIGGETGNERQIVKVQGSLLITFSLPLAKNCEQSLEGSRQSNKTKQKVLSQECQLIGALMKSDWRHLESQMAQLQSKEFVRTRDRIASFFPDKMDVTDLYSRISGAKDQLSTLLPEKYQERVPGSDDRRIDLLRLPNEVMITGLGPFLSAKSLHSLRASSRKLFVSLQSVVPSLKLDLFPHQTRSLSWMELREKSSVTEGDIIRRDDKLGGDLHRAVTGGASICLNPRRSCCNPNATRIRFDAMTGDALGAGALSTRCARGGLLCDDPGLGKSITILSLILRSNGLTTEAMGGKKNRTDDETLFKAYWESNFITDHIRRPVSLLDYACLQALLH